MHILESKTLVRRLSLFGCGLALAILANASATAPVSAGTSIDVHFRYGNVYPRERWVPYYAEYYHVSPVVVERCYQAGYPASDLSVAFFLASHSGYDVDVILDWRHDGYGWYEITRRCHVSPAIFYTSVPPYGRAYGVYGRPYKHWKRRAHDRYHFTDREAIALVHLRYATDRYDYDPHWTMRQYERDRGGRYLYQPRMYKGARYSSGYGGRTSERWRDRDVRERRHDDDDRWRDRDVRERRHDDDRRDYDRGKDRGNSGKKHGSKKGKDRH